MSNLSAKQFILNKLSKNGRLNGLNNSVNNSVNKRINNKFNQSEIKNINNGYTNTIPKLDVNYNRVIKNSKPILSNFMNDINNDRYNKYIKTCVSIDSKDRFSGDSNDYKIYLGKEFNNVTEIELINIQYPNCFSVVNSTNNKISWKYITEDEVSDYLNTDCYTPEQIEEIENEFEFPMIELDAEKVCIKPGINYTIYDLENEIMNAMNSVVHKSGEPYGVAGKLTSFYVNIDIVNERVIFINRLEEFLVNTIEVDSSGDLFFEFNSSSSNPFSIYPELLIILTNVCNTVNDIGGIPFSLINEKEFKYDTDIKFISYGAGVNRYQIILKDEDGTDIKGKYTELVSGSVCVSETGRRAVVGQGLPFVFDGDITSLLYLFGWKFPKFYEGNSCCRSESIIFCADCDNNGCESCVDSSCTNECLADCSSSNEKGGLTWSAIRVSPISLEYGLGCLKLVRIGNNVIDKKNYLLIPDSPYIFMKLKFPSLPDDKLGNNIIKAETINGSYVLDEEKCKVEHYNGDYRRKDTSNLFAKIVFDNGLNLTSIYNDHFICNKKVFYDKTLTKLDLLEVEFIDRNGYPITNCVDNNFTIKITEKMEVLKETLIDTRTGSISKTGYYM